MSSQQRRSGRAVVNSTLAVILVLMALLWPFVGAPTTNGAAIAAALAAQQPVALQGAERTYFVEWNITASGYEEIRGSDYRTVTKRKIEISGEALYHEPAQGRASAIPMKLTITDDRYYNLRDGCNDDYEWRSITDPNRYYGGPDPFWSMSGLFLPLQELDGTWFMRNPLSPWEGFTENGQLSRVFNYRTDQKWHNCRSGNRTDSYTNEMEYYYDILPPLNNIPLRGDPTGTIFSLNTEYTVETSDIPLTVNFHAVVRVVGCNGHRTPIDASDPVVTSVNVSLDVDKDSIPPNKPNTLNPPDPATLTARVTCGGTPVKNAQLRIGVKPQKNSGGHIHDGTPRPRGYLKGPGAADYTELTKRTPSIIVRTDSNGIAEVAFRPGTDNATGRGGNCAGKQRGIAGTYEVTASLVDARFEGVQAQRAIQVRRTDFVPLPLPGNHYVSMFRSSTHPQGTWGTLPTMGGIEALADRFYDYQVQHNQVLTESGKLAWPIVNLGIIDISLRDGGLFDTGGTDVCAGGKRVPFIPWQIPHQTHLNGTGVDISTNQAVTWPGSETQRNWWKSALRGLGCFYGRWAGERSLHLDVDQSAGNWGSLHAGCLKRPPSAAALQRISPFPQADAPTLFVSISQDTVTEDSYGPSITAPGQVVSLTIGVNNLSNLSDAHQVVLTATLPNGLQLVNANPPASRTGNANQPVWDIGTLTTRASLQTFSLAVQVDSRISPGTVLTMTAQATTSDSGPTLDDHSDHALLIRPAGPDLAVQAQDLEGAAMTVDQPLTFTVSVANYGSAPAPRTTLTVTLPASVTLRSGNPLTSTAEGNTLIWQLGNLAPDTLRAITMMVDLDPGLAAVVPFDPDLEAGGLLTYTLSAGTTATDIEPDNNNEKVVRPVEFTGSDLAAWLGVRGAGAAGTLAAGQYITYTLHYGNFGNQEAGEVSAALLLWPGLTLMESRPAPTINQLDTTSGVRTLTWSLGELSIGEEGTIELRLRVDNVPEVGSIIRANISSNSIDLNPADNAVMETRYEAYGPNAGGYKIFLPVVRRQ